MQKFDDKNLDVLENIEFGIVSVYRADPSLLDNDAKEAIDALVRQYRAEEDERTPPSLHLSDRAQSVFDAVQPICEWRLGRTPIPGETAITTGATPTSEMVECLRKIQKSIPFWSARDGSQGYLKFVTPYMR